MPALTTEQRQLLNRQAVVHGAEIVLVLLQRPTQPLALGGGHCAGLGDLGGAGHHQAEVVQFGQGIGAVGAQVHEPQPLGPGRGRLAPEAHRPSIHRPHRHIGVQMQTITPPEPLAPQLGDGVIDGGSGHKAHVVHFDQACGHAAPQHGQPQQGSAWGQLSCAHAGRRSCRLALRQSDRSPRRWW